MLKNKQVFDEMLAERDAKQQKTKAIKELVENMIASNINVNSAQQVKMQLYNLQNLDVSLEEVKVVLKNELDMSF